MTESAAPEDAPPDEGVALMLRLQAGEETALRGLMDLWEKPLLRYFARQVATFQEAEDLTQEVFLRLYRGAAQYQPGRTFAAYLFCVARRLLLNHWRTRRRKPLHLIGDEALAERADPGTAPERLREEEDIFAHILAELPENQRSVLLLRVQQELDYAEIAEILGLTLANVKVLLHRAREGVRTAYRHYENT